MPLPLAGETLYSLCARAHALSGWPWAKDTSLAMLGHHFGATHVHVPYGMSRLALLLGERFNWSINTRSLHTALGPHLALMSSEEKNLVFCACTSADGCGFRSLRSLHAYLFPPRRLRCCRRCLRIDAVPIWYSEHQYLGVLVCARHGELLETTHVPAFGVKRWLGPLNVAFERKSPIDSEETMSTLHRVAVAMSWLGRRGHIELRVIRLMLLQRLQVVPCDVACRTSFDSRRIAYLEDVSLAILSTFPEFHGVCRPGWLRQLLLGVRVRDPLAWATALAFTGSIASDHLSDACSRIQMCFDLFDPVLS
jgi:hypothetical protein